MFSEKNITVIFLMGSTASGKTSLAMKLCDALPCDIISVDSTQVYRGLDIGSAKPSTEQLSKYPHHLVNIRNPDDPYSVANFCDDAKNLISKIISEGRIPLLVGGTMLYFKALTTGLAKLPPANEQVRNKIYTVAQEFGWNEVWERLAKVDPESAMRLHKHDSQRLQRALEVYMISGKSLTSLKRSQSEINKFPYRCIHLAVTPKERPILHSRIASRCKQMFEAGLIEEVQGLRSLGLNPNLPSMRSVGYRQIWQHFEGMFPKDKVVEKCIVATRQLAKRQITWLRSWNNLHWLDTLSPKLLPDTLRVINDSLND